MTATMTMNDTLTREMIHQQYLSIMDQRELAEKIDAVKATAKNRFKDAVAFMFDCSRENPYNLPADIQSKMFLY